MATVVGVPSGLFLANMGGWHSPFFAIALVCAIVGVMAVTCLPRLDAHVAKAQGQQVSFAMQQVWADPNHRRALWMSAAMMFAGFTIIPYITIYTQANQVLTLDEIPYIYLCGGTVTLLTARWIGRHGKRCHHKACCASTSLKWNHIPNHRLRHGRQDATNSACRHTSCHQQAVTWGQGTGLFLRLPLCARSWV